MYKMRGGASPLSPLWGEARRRLAQEEFKAARRKQGFQVNSKKVGRLKLEIVGEDRLRIQPELWQPAGMPESLATTGRGLSQIVLVLSSLSDKTGVS